MSQDRRASQISLDATLQSINDLMSVQFANVEKNFDRIHTTMAEMKTENREETQNLERKVDKNRQIAEDRHVSLIKKVWYGAGMIAVFQLLVQLSACHLGK